MKGFCTYLTVLPKIAKATRLIVLLLLIRSNLIKNNTAFWKTWRSKFNKSAQCGQVDGCVDAEGIADKFVSHFRTAFTCNNAEMADSLKAQYLASRVNYALSDEQNFDIELVSNIILSLKCGKAAGGDG